MRLPRPHIPILTKVLVARRQIRDAMILWRHKEREESLSAYLEDCLWRLRRHFGCDELQLDHDPALGLRRFNPDTGEYRPRANDHRFMAYKPKERHLKKTTGRNPGAERTVTSKGSDIWLMAKFRKLGRKPGGRRWPKGPRSKIPSRPFPKRKA